MYHSRIGQWVFPVVVCLLFKDAHGGFSSKHAFTAHYETSSAELGMPGWARSREAIGSSPNPAGGIMIRTQIR
jgi:hypothetical protein